MLIKRLPAPRDYCPQHRIPLGKGMFAIVDAEDVPWLTLYDWRVAKSHSCYYAVRRFIRDGKIHTVRMHRQLVDCPRGMQVHHINGNTLDNRRVNLSIIEPALHAQLKNRYIG